MWAMRTIVMRAMAHTYFDLVSETAAGSVTPSGGLISPLVQTPLVKKG